LDFDFAKANSQKITLCSTQYAHARVCSVLRKGAELGRAPVNHDFSLLVDEAERHVVKRLAE
jgi:arginyl-tRNA synthetase